LLINRISFDYSLDCVKQIKFTSYSAFLDFETASVLLEDSR